MSVYSHLAAILHKAQAHTSVETGKPIDIGGEVVAVRREYEAHRDLLAAYAERYRCKCRHNRCKRCEMDRRAAEILARRPEL